MSNITQEFIRKNKKFLDVAAINYRGNIIEYSHLNDLIYYYVKSFKKLGVNSGDVVTICLATIPDNMILFYALNYIGAIVNFINPLDLVAHYERYINDVNSEFLIINREFLNISSNVINLSTINKVLITSNDYYSKEKINVCNDRVALDKKISVYEMDDFLREGYSLSQIVLPYDFCNNEIMGYFYTGGTTGLPKRVAMSNRTILEMVKIYESKASLMREYGDLNYIIIPPSHFTGAVQTNIIPSFFGSTNMHDPIYDPRDVIKKIVFEKVNSVTLTMTFWNYIMLNSNLGSNDLINLKKPCTGGESVSYGAFLRANEFLNGHGAGSLINGYGSTEAGGPLLINGVPLDRVDIALFDENGKEIENENQIGTLGFKTPTSMIGYSVDGNLVFDDYNGYFLIGDRAKFSYDESGKRKYDIVGREKQRVVSPITKKVTYLSEYTEIGESFLEIFQCHAIKKQINGEDNIVVFITIDESNLSNSKEILLKLDKKMKENQLDVYCYKIRTELTKVNEITAKSDMSSLNAINNDFIVVTDGEIYNLNNIDEYTFDSSKKKIRKK